MLQQIIPHTHLSKQIRSFKVLFTPRHIRKILLLKTWIDYSFRDISNQFLNFLITCEFNWVKRTPNCVNYLVISASLPHLKVYMALYAVFNSIFAMVKIRLFLIGINEVLTIICKKNNGDLPVHISKQLRFELDLLMCVGIVIQKSSMEN